MASIDKDPLEFRDVETLNERWLRPLEPPLRLAQPRWIETANALFPWRDKIKNNELNNWAFLHDLVCKAISNERLLQKGNQFKIVYSIALETYQEVIGFNPREAQTELVASHALRAGYKIEPFEGRLVIYCPSGQQRSVTRTECDCSHAKPCVHLRLAQAFLDRRQAFKP
ncbi:MAG: hypothetical protein ABEK59_02850 [Halobacteria archaeon]